MCENRIGTYAILVKSNGPGERCQIRNSDYLRGYKIHGSIRF